LFETAQALGQHLGMTLGGGTAGGGSDGSTASLHTATLDGLGPVGDGAHAAHEYIEIGPTLDRAALLALLLVAPAGRTHGH
jgi:glutamate carboxypeptidase